MPDEVSKAAEAIGKIPEIIGTDTKETIDARPRSTTLCRLSISYWSDRI